MRIYIKTLAAVALLATCTVAFSAGPASARPGFSESEVFYRKYRGDDEVSDRDREDRSGHGGGSRDDGRSSEGSGRSGGSSGKNSSGSNGNAKGKAGTGSNDLDDRFGKPRR